jgi:hypothetical protein
MSGQDQIRVLTAETAQLRIQLAAANKRAEVAEAEVAAWRGAVRWHTIGDIRLELRLRGVGSYSHEFGAVDRYTSGWIVEIPGIYKVGMQPDRDTACRKVCELLGLPVVLP